MFRSCALTLILIVIDKFGLMIHVNTHLSLIRLQAATAYRSARHHTRSYHLTVQNYCFFFILQWVVPSGEPPCSGLRDMRHCHLKKNVKLTLTS